jgi:hypothetical protein
MWVAPNEVKPLGVGGQPAVCGERPEVELGAVRRAQSRDHRPAMAVAPANVNRGWGGERESRSRGGGGTCEATRSARSDRTLLLQTGSFVQSGVVGSAELHESGLDGNKRANGRPAGPRLARSARPPSLRAIARVYPLFARAGLAEDVCSSAPAGWGSRTQRCTRWRSAAT